MTRRLVPGENLPWPDGRLTAYVDRSVDVSALLLDASYRVREPADHVTARAPRHAGVEWIPGATQGVTLDLAALGSAGHSPVERVLVLASLSAGAFGAEAPTVQLLSAAGEVLAAFSPEVPAGQSAVVLVEVYRRGAGWRVRAVGRGYGGGLPEALAAHGAETAGRMEDVRMEEGRMEDGRMFELAAMILDDASRTTASLRSTTAFAEARLDTDLESIVSDPTLRVGATGDRARTQARARHDELVDRARAAHARDLAQLTDEVAALEDRLAPAMSRWGSRGWAAGQSARPASPGIRIGELSLTEAPDFRLPLLFRLPLRRPLWVDPELGGDAAATAVLHVLGARISLALADYRTSLVVIDVGGERGTLGFPPGLLARPPVTDAATATRALVEHVGHVDLVRMAIQGGAVDSLTPEQSSPRVLLLTDFPTGLDETAVRAVQRLVMDGPSAGVQLLMTGTTSRSLDVPLLERVYDACLRLPSGPGGELTDGYGEVDWRFVPDPGPGDGSLERALGGLIHGG